jgi:tetratricopeptide (TPR) repeat protein
MYCVIVGDVIKSRRLTGEQQNELNKKMKAAFDNVNFQYSQYVFVNFSIVRGDGFEGVLISAGKSFQILYEIIKKAYPYKMRISVVMGELSSVGSRSDINQVNGPAIISAYSYLDEMKKRGKAGFFNIAFNSGYEGQPLISATLALLGTVTNRWTDRQREIVWAMEKYARQRDVVAKESGISEAAVSKHLAVADYEEYNMALGELENYGFAMDARGIARKKEAKPGSLAYLSVGWYECGNGNFKKALNMFKKALSAAKNEFGEESGQLIDIYIAIGYIQRELEKYDEALLNSQTALKICETNSVDKSELAYTLEAVGSVYGGLKRWNEALNCFKKALSIYENIYDKHNMYIAGCYMDLANVYARINNNKKALTCYEVALKIYNVNDKPDTLETAGVYFNLGNFYLLKSDYISALDFYNKSISIFKKLLPKNHLIYADIYFNIGIVYSVKNDFINALANYNLALKIYEKIKHPKTIKTHAVITKIKKKTEECPR